MSILAQLSSQVGERTEAANRRAAAACLKNPALLVEIARGLSHADAALVGDCAEVLTKVAEEEPQLVAPYAQTLAPLLGHKNARVRWETAHALALVAGQSASLLPSLLPRYRSILQGDPSPIVRDWAVTALGNYAASGEAAAEAAYPLLKQALSAWQGKHAGRALIGLGHVGRVAPRLATDVRRQAQRFVEDQRGVVRNAARSILRARV